MLPRLINPHIGDLDHPVSGKVKHTKDMGASLRRSNASITLSAEEERVDTLRDIYVSKETQ